MSQTHSCNKGEKVRVWPAMNNLDSVVYSVKFAAAHRDWRPRCTDAYEDVWVSIPWETPAKAAQSLSSNESATAFFSLLSPAES